jgi:hypothetical protein
LTKPFRLGTLLFDFNCMIYQILRAPDTFLPFPGYSHPDADAWEADVCQRICDYTSNVWSEVGKPKTVFLAIDGVVPNGQNRQQRLRRFKSIWYSQGGSRTGHPFRMTPIGGDTNCNYTGHCLYGAPPWTTSLRNNVKQWDGHLVMHQNLGRVSRNVWHFGEACMQDQQEALYCYLWTRRRLDGSLVSPNKTTPQDARFCLVYS